MAEEFDYTAAQEAWDSAGRETEAPERATGLGSSISKGFAHGVDTTQALLGGAVGLAGTAAKKVTGGAFGSGLEAWGQESYKEQMRQASLSLPKEGTGTFAEADSIGDYANWAAFNVASQVPNLLTMAGTGGIGGAAGKAVVGRLVSQEIGKDIAGGTLRGLAARTAKGEIASKAGVEALKRVTEAQRVGQTLGVIGGTSALESGGMYGEQVSEGLEPSPGKIALSGLASGALEAVVPLGVLKKLGAGRAVVEGAEKHLPSALKTALGIGGTATTEAATEIAQEVISRANLEEARGADLDAKETWDRILDPEALGEVAALGGLLGGVAGGVGAVGHRRFETKLPDLEKREKERRDAEQARIREEETARQAEQVALGRRARVEEIARKQKVNSIRERRARRAEAAQQKTPETFYVGPEDQPQASPVLVPREVSEAQRAQREGETLRRRGERAEGRRIDERPLIAVGPEEGGVSPAFPVREAPENIDATRTPVSTLERQREETIQKEREWEQIAQLPVEERWNVASKEKREEWTKQAGTTIKNADKRDWAKLGSRQKEALRAQPLESLDFEQRKVVEQKLGDVVDIKRAQKAGALEIITSEEAARRGWNEKKSGEWNRQEGRMTVRETAKDPVGTLLHEGLHGGDETLLHRSYDAIQKQFEKERDKGNETLTRADVFARKAQELSGLSEVDYKKERLAYAVNQARLGEGEKAKGWLRGVLDDVKSWWRTTEIGQRLASAGIAPKLDDAMLLGIAKRAFRTTTELRELEDAFGGEPNGLSMQRETRGGAALGEEAQRGGAEEAARLSEETPEGLSNASGQRETAAVDVRGEEERGGPEEDGRNLAEGRGGILSEEEGARRQSLAEGDAESVRGPEELGNLEFDEALSPEELNDYARRNREMRQADRTRSEKAGDLLYRAFAPGGLLARRAKGAYEWIQRRDARQNMIDDSTEQLVRALERESQTAFGKKWGELGEEKGRMQKALEGNNSALGMLPEKIQTTIVAMRELIDPLSEEYVRALREQIGMNARELGREDLPEPVRKQQEEQLSARRALASVFEKNLGSYLNRSYKMFDDKNWWKNVPDDVRNKARKYLEGEGMTRDQADSYMNELLKNNTAYDSMADWIREGRVGETDKRVLIRRGKLAKPMLDLMGVYEDPRVNFAKTAAKLSRLVLNTRLQKELRRKGLEGGWLWETGDLGTETNPRPADITQTIQGGKNYEYLAGLKTSPEVMRGLKDAMDRVQNPAWLNSVVRVAQAAKWTKTIGSPAPTGIRNYVSAWMGLAANADWSGAGLKNALAGANEYLRNINVGNQHEALKHKKLLGVSLDTPYAGEMKELSRQAGIDSALAAEPNELKTRLDVARQKVGRAKKDLERFYQFGDDFIKIIAFESQKKQLGGVFGEELRARYEREKGQTEWEGESYGRVELREKDGKWSFRDPFGVDIQIGNKSYGSKEEAQADASNVLTNWDVENRAAERVRNTYMTYSMVGKLPKWFARFPLTGTFVSFPIEVLRTVSNMVKYTAEDLRNEKTRGMGMRRLAGMSTVGAGVYGLEALIRSALGVDDDELKAARQAVPEWNKLSNLIPIGRDEKGNLELFDFGYVDLYKTWRLLPNALMNEGGVEEKLGDVAKEFLAPFFGLDITAQAVHEVLMNKRAQGGQIWNYADSPLVQSEKILGHLMKPFTPSSLLQGEKVRKALDGYTTRDGRKLEVSTEMAALFGAKAINVDPARMLFYGNYEFQERKRDYMRVLSRAIGDPNMVGEEELRGMFEGVKEARKGVYEQLIRRIDAAKELGISKLKLRQELRGLRIPTRDVAALIAGRVPRWQPTRTTFSGVEKKGKSLYGKETLREIRRKKQMVLRWMRTG